MPLLFSYGTLQQDDVQLATFGRLLQGHHDELPGFTLVPAGVMPHANVTFTGRPDHRVSGMVFEVTDAELAAADRYEAQDAYARRSVTLASGRQAWVYAYDPSKG